MTQNIGNQLPYSLTSLSVDPKVGLMIHLSVPEHYNHGDPRRPQLTNVAHLLILVIVPKFCSRPE